MSNKGRHYLNVDLITPELEAALNEMVAQDRSKQGEMNPSLFVRNLIRTEYARRKEEAFKALTSPEAA